MILKKILNNFRQKAVEHSFSEPKQWIINSDDKFLILAPHPDDDTVGCGGLLALFPNQCDVICLTDGRYGDSSIAPEELIKIRRAEFENVMQNTGVNSFKMLGIEDSKLIDSNPDLNLEKYTHILIPSPNDIHPDHRAVSYLLQKYYQKYYKKVVYYELISLLSNPTHILDISSVICKKQENMGKYCSQMKFINYIDRISALNRYRGLFFHYDFAEAYQFFQK